jgi:hypothetical protein
MARKRTLTLLAAGLLMARGVAAQVADDEGAAQVLPADEGAAQAPASPQPAGTDFYVTGIFGQADKGYEALVELADGRHRQVRVGSMIGTARVEEVAPQWIRLREPGAEEARIVPLKGTGRIIEATPLPVSAAKDKPQRPPAQEDRPTGPSREPGAPSDASGIGSSPVPAVSRGQAKTGPGEALPGERDMTQLAQELSDLRRDVKANGSSGNLGQIIGPVLGLPGDARVVEIQSASPRDIGQSLRYIEAQAERNQIIRMTIETGGERQRVMVFPGTDGGAARVESFPLGKVREKSQEP